MTFFFRIENEYHVFSYFSVSLLEFRPPELSDGYTSNAIFESTDDIKIHDKFDLNKLYPEDNRFDF